MPHIHLEYSDNIDTLEVKPILLALNQALLDGQFVQSGNDIKSRAIRQSDFVIGVDGDAQAYLHAKVSLLSGRDEATKCAISSQLLDITIDGSRGILFNITGGPSLTLMEVNQAAAIIKETAHPDVNLIFGVALNPAMNDEMSITVIATGFDDVPGSRKVPDFVNFNFGEEDTPAKEEEPSFLDDDLMRLFSGNR